MSVCLFALLMSRMFFFFQWRARNDILVDSFCKRIYIKYFFKLLFTEQNEELLHIISSTLIEMICKNSRPNVLFQIFLRDLFVGFINLGKDFRIVISSMQKFYIQFDWEVKTKNFFFRLSMYSMSLSHKAYLITWACQK